MIESLRQGYTSACPTTQRVPLIHRAIATIPRRVFVRTEAEALAFDDRNIPGMELQALWAPDALVAILTALAPNHGRRVLQIGVGSGYCAAILDRMGLEVFAIDPVKVLVELATRNLERVGCEGVHLQQAAPHAGWPDTASFDAVLVSYPSVPVSQALREQLAVGGHLIVVTGRHLAHQSIVRISRTTEHSFQEERLGEVRLCRRTGDLLVELGLAKREDVDHAAEEARTTRRRIGEILVARKGLSEAAVYRALAAQKGVKFGTLDSLVHHVDLRAVRAVPRSFLEHNRFLPVSRKEGRLTVATCDSEPNLVDLGKAIEHDDVEICLVTPTDFRRLWSSVDLMLSGRSSNIVLEEDAKSPEKDLSAVQSGDDESHLVHLFEMLLLEAIGERASDIHVERYGERVRVRIRVDGDLRDMNRFRLTPQEQQGMLNVLKIRTGMDIAEHRLPQAGRMRIRVDGKAFDMRVQTQPALHGEHAILRVLPQQMKLLDVEDLGFPGPIAKAYRRLVDEPSGLVLVVGPTGSGKSTTLYAALQILAQDMTRKVITIEDPIEYSIEGIQQTQVRREIGFAFAEAMKAFLREDPDVILVGEIRDHETALEAMRASQTGHLVLSTLHCGDSIDTVQRLLDLNLNPNTIGSELLAVIPQRLARRNCEECKAPNEPDPALLREVFPEGPPPDFRSFKGVGCQRCSGFGTLGRISVVEFLRVNDEIRTGISRRLPVHELRYLGVRAGMIPMRETALGLVVQGMIPFTELPEILPTERLSGVQPA